MSNTKGQKAVGMRKFMQKRAFADGFHDVHNDRDWRADEYGVHCLAHEYGRHFATVWDGLSFKNGNTINTAAVWAFSRCLSDDDRLVVK